MLCFPNFRTKYILIKRCVVSYCRQKNTLGMAWGGAKLLSCTTTGPILTQIYRPIHNNTYMY